MNEPLVTTLVIAHSDTDILLGMKKRGFGAGRWNGFGGKVREDESVEEAARREFQEEAGCNVEALSPSGVISFSFEDEGERPIEMHLFRAEMPTEEPRETEEMRPQRFLHVDIPYQEMWPDDIHWLPRFLGGEHIRAHFHFKDTNTLLHASFEE